jgi:hypothetical protein
VCIRHIRDKGTYVLEDLDGTVFRHTTAGNRLKPFHVRTAYADAGGVGGQGTTTLLGGDEADDDETDQAEDEAAALEAEGGVEVEGENEDRMFAVVV